MGMLIAVMLALAPVAAIARALPCHAVAPAGAPLAADSVAALRFDCGPLDESFRGRWLWLKLAVPPSRTTEYNLIVRPTRVDRMRIVTRYADGVSEVDEVRAGNFDGHWAADNRLAFDLPDRDSAPVAVYLGLDNLAFPRSVMPELVSSDQARFNSASAALVIGASLSLLVASLVYNLSRLIAQRQRALIGHVAWSALMTAWGLLWSQTILFVLPGIAGTWSARLGTLCAAGSIAAASALFASIVEPPYLSGRARRTIVAVGAVPFVIAVLTTFELGRYTWLMEPVVNLAAVLPVAASLVIAAVAIRRGSVAAREFLIAWTLPMVAVIVASLSDVSFFPGDSGQMSVLAASALQAILLSLTVSMRLGAVRAERDRARALGAEYQHQALTDEMTGLANRRGFVGAVETMLRRSGVVGMILLDLDHFKSVNDGHGHLAGDAVLARVGAALADAAPVGAVVGRMGGEEFALAVPGLRSGALVQAAEGIRRTVSGIALADLLGERILTCSLGVSDSANIDRPTFDDLFRAADRGLYAAKRDGRDRVAVHVPERRRTA